MPKTYLCDNSGQQKARIIRYLIGASAGTTQRELAEVWDISQQAAGHRLKSGNVTLLDLWKARNLMKIDAKDIMYLIGGDQ